MDQYMQDLVTQFLGLLGEDTEREGLQKTPERVARAWTEITAGYNQTVEDALTTFEERPGNQMIFVGSIPFFSTCEHHLLPFFGNAHIGYIPSGRIIGLSKFPRILNIFARRLTVQERITDQVADAITEHLEPKGVGVVLQARHTCMEIRGVKTSGAITQTVALRGDCLKEAECRAEFMTLVKIASDGIKGL